MSRREPLSGCQRHTRMTLPRAAFFALVLLLKAVRSAEAAPAPAPVSAVVEEAEQHRRSGQSAAERGDMQGAIAHFRQCLDLVEAPGCACDLDKVYRVMGNHCAELTEAFVTCQRSRDKESRTTAERDVKECASKVGSLVIESVPNATDVFVDGKPAGKAPLTKWYDHPGEHEIELRAPGYAAAKETAHVELGRRITRAVSLLKLAKLEITVRPAHAKLTIDGEVVASPSTEPLPLAPGHHTVAADALEYRRASMEIDLAPDENKHVVLSLEHEQGRIAVVSHPEGAQVQVDGTSAGRAPVALSVDTGHHTVVVGDLKGRLSRSVDVNAGPDKVASVDVSLPRWRTPWLIGVPSAAAALAGGALAWTSAVQGAHARDAFVAAGTAQSWDQNKPDHDSARRLNLVGWAVAGAGLAGLAAAATMYECCTPRADPGATSGAAKSDRRAVSVWGRSDAAGVSVGRAW